jgi:hypothetical protein
MWFGVAPMTDINKDMCFIEIGLRIQNMIFMLLLNSQHGFFLGGGHLANHSMGLEIFTFDNDLDIHMIFKMTTKLTIVSLCAC